MENGKLYPDRRYILKTETKEFKDNSGKVVKTTRTVLMLNPYYKPSAKRAKDIQDLVDYTG